MSFSVKFIATFSGSTDEPHLRAFVWNILGAIWTHIKKPEMIDLPFKEGKHDQSVEG